MTTLEYGHVTRRFGNVVALDDFSLTVPGGKLVTLLGPSGCGKTTALRIAAGFDIPDGGRLVMGGHVVSHVPPRRRNAGMVFQAYSLFPHMTVAENVGFGLRIRKVSPATRSRQVSEMLELVQIGHLAGRYPHQLSGGQQQRVALARALVFEPSVLLLDEPLSALDAQVRTEVRDVIRGLQFRLGTTTLFVTHDQEEAISVSDLVCVMKDGRPHQVDTPENVYMRPATEFVARFVGETIEVPTPRGRCLVRPENLVLVAPEEARAMPGVTFVGHATSVRFNGSTCTVTVAVPMEDIVLNVKVLPHQATLTRVHDEVGVVATSLTYAL